MVCFDQTPPKSKEQHNTLGHISHPVARSLHMTAAQFAYRKNLKHLREVLTRTSNERKCQQIVRMIEAEETKQREEN
jgi:hypothetical protein